MPASIVVKDLCWSKSFVLEKICYIHSVPERVRLCW